MFFSILALRPAYTDNDSGGWGHVRGGGGADFSAPFKIGYGMAFFVAFSK
ncbi:MAG: hypothetical protein HN708_00915 [Candidatus Marinimicrobia bacterium]|nr:hypothetical protein [Thiotrichales bacterium]MBT7828804.1 hypothetical protein [Candidatus Neomarinimicrobiota bacterium]